MDRVQTPTFFLVGAPRCGTSSMHAYLREHPDIFMPAEKELQPFGEDLKFRHNASFPRRRYRVSLERFLTYFEGAGAHQIAGDASSYSLVSERAAIEIRDFCPQAKIIAMLRHPVEMMYSWHARLVASGNEDILDFGEALEAEADRAQGRRVPRSASQIHGLEYRKMCSFSDQLSRFFSVFGRDKVHVIIFERFARDPAAVFEDTLGFLGVDASFSPEFRVVNPYRPARSAGLSRLIARPPGFLSSVAEGLFSRVPKARTIARSLVHQVNRPSRPKPQLPDELRTRLCTELEVEIESLRRLLDDPLSEWMQTV